MSKDNRNALKRALEQQIGRIESLRKLLDARYERISIYRLGVFLMGSVATYLAIRYGTTTLGILTPAVFLAGFLGLVAWHQSVERSIRKFDLWRTIRATHLSRMELNWSGIPAPDQPEEKKDHPYATDLHITGRHSLLNLMDTSIYEGGRDRLRAWLLENAPVRERIGKRQRLVQELRPMAYFRDRLQLKAAITRSKESPMEWTMNDLIRWLRDSRKDSYARELFILGTLALANVIFGILYLTGTLGPYVFFSFVLYLTLYSLNYSKVKGLFDTAYEIERLLTRFRSLLLYLESYPYKQNSRLREFCSIYHRAETRPSKFLNKAIRLTAAAALQKSELLRGIINLLLPWDLYFSHRLNRYKDELTEPLERWLDRFYDLEALCSMANYGWINPDYIHAVPEEFQRERVFEAEGLGHPLIPRREKVTNEISIDRLGSLLLITGSNMSGKSTFLRTLGINLCLCFAGAPVNARSFSTIPFRLYSSINVPDSLDEGFSHFYAEVRKLKQMLVELERGGNRAPLFFLVDEIFRGTNNRERLIGSRAFLRYTAGKMGVGVFSTHDLELASLEEEIPLLTNYHFEETIRDGRMTFEYKLKPGPCPTTNALKIMEMEGLPVGTDPGEEQR